MFTKKAQKQLKKLPPAIQRAAVKHDESETFGKMLQSQQNRLVSIRIHPRYRMVKDRNTKEVLWVGTHEDYNKKVKKGGIFE